ncbi:MAG: hypothetical protein K1W34_14935 [Lachnospiraceae bacterium]
MLGGISGISPYTNSYRYHMPSLSRMDQAQAVRKAGMVMAAGGRTSSPGTPVEPVDPVPVVSAQAGRGISYAIPFLRKGMDPAELAVRMRIRYDEGVRKTPDKGECQTCKERKYQDGSDDAGVSYKTPTHISPEQAASAVRGHEMEHVVREQAKAKNSDREVVSQSVTLHNEICPECGRVFVSGGVTRTVTAESQNIGTDIDTDTNTKDFKKAI